MSTWIRKHIPWMHVQLPSPIYIPCPNTDLIKMFTKFSRVCCLSISPLRCSLPRGLVVLKTNLTTSLVFPRKSPDKHKVKSLFFFLFFIKAISLYLWHCFYSFKLKGGICKSLKLEGTELQLCLGKAMVYSKAYSSGDEHAGSQLMQNIMGFTTQCLNGSFFCAQVWPR